LQGTAGRVSGLRPGRKQVFAAWLIPSFSVCAVPARKAVEGSRTNSDYAIPSSPSRLCNDFHSGNHRVDFQPGWAYSKKEPRPLCHQEPGLARRASARYTATATRTQFRPRISSPDTGSTAIQALGAIQPAQGTAGRVSGLRPGRKQVFAWLAPSFSACAAPGA
jgi:hypothetical protein